MTAADLATVAHITALSERIDRLTLLVQSLSARLPSQWISLSDTAEALDCDPQTVRAMCERNELVWRRCGRRIVVDSASLRPADPAAIAAMAREARR